MISLSAAWRSGLSRPAEEVVEPLLAALGRLPFGGLALDGGVNLHALSRLRPVLQRREIPLPLFRGAVGAPPPERPRLPPRLCAPDPDERAAAVALCERALEIAGDLGVPILSVSLGAVDPDPAFARRDRAFTEEEAIDLRRAALAAKGVRPRSLDAARFALEALCRRALAQGVRVALETPALPLEIGAPEELHRLIAGLAGAPIGYAHDIAAARLCKDLGGPPGREHLDAGRAHLCAVLLSDAKDREMGLVVGRGEIDFAGFARTVPAGIPRVLAARRDWSETELQEALERLTEAGF